MPSSDASYINATNGEKKQENNDDDYREIDHKLKKQDLHLDTKRDLTGTRDCQCQIQQLKRLL